MIRIAGEKWVADLQSMTCRNYIDDITVEYKKDGDELVGQIVDMGVEMVDACLSDFDGDMFLERIYCEADFVFFRAYFDRIREDEEKYSQDKLR